MEIKLIILREWSARVRALIETEGKNYGEWTKTPNDTAWYAYMIVNAPADADYFAGFIRGILTACNQQGRHWSMPLTTRASKENLQSVFPDNTGV